MNENCQLAQWHRAQIESVRRSRSTRRYICPQANIDQSSVQVSYLNSVLIPPYGLSRRTAWLLVWHLGKPPYRSCIGNKSPALFNLGSATHRDRHPSKQHVLHSKAAWKVYTEHSESFSPALFPKQPNPTPKRESASNHDMIGSFEGLERLLMKNRRSESSKTCFCPPPG